MNKNQARISLHNTQMLSFNYFPEEKKIEARKREAEIALHIIHTLCKSVFNLHAAGVTPSWKYLHGKEFGSP